MSNEKIAHSIQMNGMAELNTALTNEAAASRSAKQANASLANTLLAQNQELSNEVDELRQALQERDQIIARQKDLLRQWMISQTAFKNLFKKYGKLPDGRTVDDMTDSEKTNLVNKEKDNVEQTGAGLEFADQVVRSAILGNRK